MKKHSEGDEVKWSWGNGHGYGTIQSVFEKKVTRKINGTEVTRNGGVDNPAYYICVDDGNNVLKLHTEIEIC